MKNHENTINEMALRLRSAGRWDNTLADRVQALCAFLAGPKDDAPFHPSTITRKASVDGYADARDQLVAVLRHRLVTCPADVESCLTMALLLRDFERADIEAPTVRLGAGGFCIAEWDGRGGGHIAIQHGLVFWECFPKKYHSKMEAL